MKADDEAFDMHSSADVSTIKDVLLSVDIDKDKSSVLLHHSPDGIRYANAKGIDLYLTGHTHAGQMFPNGIYFLTIPGPISKSTLKFILIK